MTLRQIALTMLVMIVLLVAACSTPAATMSVSATATISASADSALTSLPTVTSTPPASATLALTAQPITPTPAATSTPKMDVEATAYWAQATTVVQLVVATEQPRVLAGYPSPDGRWLIKVLNYDCAQVVAGAAENAYDQLILVRRSDGTEQPLAGQLRTCGGLGAYGLGGLFWTRDSRYFYYTDAREGEPDGGCGYWVRPVWRADADTQTVRAVGGAEFSPDRSKLAMWQDNAVVIWDVEAGEIGRATATAPEAFPSSIAWSPDGRALVYLQTAVECPRSGHATVSQLDLSPLASHLLFESDSPSFGALAWPARNQLTLVDDQGQKWSYDLVDHKLTRLDGPK